MIHTVAHPCALSLRLAFHHLQNVGACDARSHESITINLSDVSDLVPYRCNLVDSSQESLLRILRASEPAARLLLDFLSEQERAVFKTAFELDQRWVVEHAADRAPFICQSQSVNLFLPANVHKRDLHQIHMMAWKRGVKSLYYCRSLSIQRADAISEKVLAGDVMAAHVANAADAAVPLAARGAAAGQNAANYEECLACQ